MIKEDVGGHVQRTLQPPLSHKAAYYRYFSPPYPHIGRLVKTLDIFRPTSILIPRQNDYEKHHLLAAIATPPNRSVYVAALKSGFSFQSDCRLKISYFKLVVRSADLTHRWEILVECDLSKCK